MVIGVLAVWMKCWSHFLCNFRFLDEKSRIYLCQEGSSSANISLCISKWISHFIDLSHTTIHKKLISSMIISSFIPQVPPEPINTIIKQLFADRLHRRLKVDRSDFTLLPAPPETIHKECSQVSQRSGYSQGEEMEVTILREVRPKVERQIKAKMIQKAGGKGRFREEQKEANRRYNHYLLNFLHKTNLLLIRDRIPPNLSVLQTVDQGEYLLGDDNLYQRKDYPHFSNVILPEQLTPDNCKCIFQRQFQRVRPEETIFQLDDNCVLKLRQVTQFVGVLFKRSIQFCKRRKARVEEGESENHDFEAIAETLGIAFRTAKLLGDMLDSFYDFEREMTRGEEAKLRAVGQIKGSLKEILKDYSSNPSVHIPHREQYISLRELRQLLINKMLQQTQN